MEISGGGGNLGELVDMRVLRQRVLKASEGGSSGNGGGFRTILVVVASGFSGEVEGRRIGREITGGGGARGRRR